MQTTTTHAYQFFMRHTCRSIFGSIPPPTPPLHYLPPRFAAASAQGCSRNNTQPFFHATLFPLVVNSCYLCGPRSNSSMLCMQSTARLQDVAPLWIAPAASPSTRDGETRPISPADSRMRSRFSNKAQYCKADAWMYKEFVSSWPP